MYIREARNKSNIIISLPLVIRKLLKIFFFNQYKRLFMDFYIDNAESLKKIDLTQLHESKNDFKEYFKID